MSETFYPDIRKAGQVIEPGEALAMLLTALEQEFLLDHINTMVTGRSNQERS